MKNVLVSLILVVAAALAGCARGNDPTDGTDVVDAFVNSMEGFVDPFLMGHDHADATLHDLAFHTVELSHHPLGGTNVKSSGAHAMDIRGSWLFVAAYGLVADVQGGVYIFNIADPENPVLTGQWPMAGNVGGDRSMEATDDANWIVIGTEAIDCANHANPFGPGLYLIDARDKGQPLLSDYIPSTGIHSVAVQRVGDHDYVVTGGGTQNILEINPDSGKFVPMGSIPVGHDMSFFDDPLLGAPLLLVANVENLKAYDFSDPSAPEELGSWAPEDVTNHYVHYVVADIIDGKRILVLESEDWQSEPSPVWILDATELDAMTLVTTWTNPANAPANAGQDANSLAFSTHNPRIEDGIVYLAHYHGGVWILDLRTLDKVYKPEIMGYFVPHNDNGGYKPQSSSSALPLPTYSALCFGGFTIHELPNVMDVEVKDGVVYAADLHTGVYTLKWDPTVIPG